MQPPIPELALELRICREPAWGFYSCLPPELLVG